MEKILLAVGKKSNRILVFDLLRNNYAVGMYSKELVPSPSFDLIVVDSKTIPEFLINRILPQAPASRIFQPVLLITPKKSIQDYPPVYWQAVDDLITTPISKTELFTRVESLLLARRQSQELYKRLHAENAESMRDDIRFLDLFSNMSHELRTPLSVLLAGIGLLEKTLQDPSQDELSRQALHIAKRNCLRLLRIDNNILDLAKADAGCLKLQLQNIRIAEFLGKIVDMVQPYAKQKQIRLLFSPGSFDGTIAADQAKLGKIMLNLLSNAIRFTKPGGMISVRIQKSVACKRVSVTVQDNGPGIPKEKQSIIFRPFVQADDSLDKMAEGSGLGLAVVKSLVELHGGSIRVQSKAGFGSKFVFDLPLRRISEESDSLVGPYDFNSNISCEFSEL